MSVKKNILHAAAMSSAFFAVALVRCSSAIPPSASSLSRQHRGDDHHRHLQQEQPVEAALDAVAAAATITTTTTTNNNNNNNNNTNNNNTTNAKDEYGKFSSFNELLSSIEIAIPDVSFSQSGVDIAISQIACRDLAVNDVILDRLPLSSLERRLSARVEGVYISCSFRWDYFYDSLFDASGGGIGKATSDATTSVLSADVDFTSSEDTLVAAPKIDAVVSSCSSGLRVKDMTFDHDDDGGLGGALVSTVINAMEGSLRDTIRVELNGFVWDEVGKLNGTFDNLLTETPFFVSSAPKKGVPISDYTHNTMTQESVGRQVGM